MVTVVASDTVQYECGSTLYFPTPCDQYQIVCDIPISQDISGTVRLKMTITPDIPVFVRVRYAVNGVIMNDKLFDGVIPANTPKNISQNVNVNLTAGDIVSVAIMNECDYGSTGWDYIIAPFQICFDALTTGSLSISSIPEGANIYIDDILQTSTTPAIITDLSEGTHTYKLTLDGYNDATGTFDIIVGQTTVIEEVLTPAVTTGTLDISSTPEGADIYIDDILQTSTTPVLITDLSEGSHTYRLTLDGYNDATGTFYIIAGQTTTVVEVLEPIVATRKGGELGPIIISSLAFGMIFPSKNCNRYTTKEECESHGCKWENGRCIKR